MTTDTIHHPLTFGRRASGAGAGAAVSLPRALPSPAEIGHASENVAWARIVLAAALQFGSIGMLMRQQRRLLLALGVRVPLRRMAAITYSSTALAISLPAGTAFSAHYSYGQFRANGASPRAAGLALVLSGLLSISSLVAIVAIVAVGLGFSSATAGDGFAATPPVLALATAVPGIAAIAAIGRAVARHRASRPRVEPEASWLDRVQRRAPRIGRAMRGAREVLRDARSLPAGDVRLAMGTSAGKWLLDAACLCACTAALGVGLALWEVVAVYLAVQLVRQIPVTPGGLGLVEVALIAGTVSAGAALGAATAAMIVYRLLSAWLLIPIGYLVTALHGRGGSGRRRAASARRVPGVQRPRPDDCAQ